MRKIIILRHGKTEWNDLGKIQGRTNTVLSQQGRNQISKWQLPSEYQNAEWVCSPLKRTLQTARILGINAPRVDSNIEEMDWGQWTGKTLAELRAEHGESFSRNEQNGLDFQTPEGESPRDVRTRVCAFLKTVKTDERPLCIVTHKGVIRAFISAATGWDLKSDYGEKLKRDVVHHFKLDETRTLRLVQLNIPTIAKKI